MWMEKSDDLTSPQKRNISDILLQIQVHSKPFGYNSPHLHLSQTLFLYKLLCQSLSLSLPSLIHSLTLSLFHL